MTGPYSTLAKTLSATELQKLRSTLGTVGQLKGDVANLTASAVTSAGRGIAERRGRGLPEVNRDAHKQKLNHEPGKHQQESEQDYPSGANGDLSPLVVGLADTLNKVVMADDLGEICLGVAIRDKPPPNIASLCNTFLTAKVALFKKVTENPRQYGVNEKDLKDLLAPTTTYATMSGQLSKEDAAAIAESLKRQ